MNPNAAATELRRYFSISPRSRRWRNGEDLHGRMIEAIVAAATQPGYFSSRTESILSSAYSAAISYDKHIRGYRANGIVVGQVNSMSPWQFAGLIGEMVDAGVSNTGEGERFFQRMRAA